MNWRVEKCPCGQKGCWKYHIEHPEVDSTFYQGCGWDKETAERIASYCNWFEGDGLHFQEGLVFYKGRVILQKRSNVYKLLKILYENLGRPVRRVDLLDQHGFKDKFQLTVSVTGARNHLISTPYFINTISPKGPIWLRGVKLEKRDGKNEGQRVQSPCVARDRGR